MFCLGNANNISFYDLLLFQSMYSRNRKKVQSEILNKLKKLNSKYRFNKMKQHFWPKNNYLNLHNSNSSNKFGMLIELWKKNFMIIVLVYKTIGYISYCQHIRDNWFHVKIGVPCANVLVKFRFWLYDTFLLRACLTEEWL